MPTQDSPESAQWRDRCIEDWKRILGPFAPRIKSVLEVGAWEGKSALFWHQTFGATVECIDNWENISLPREVAAQVEANFDANIKGTPIFKLKHDSTLVLHIMAQHGRSYDLIYIDGDHFRDQVMIDSCLAWRLLKPGGIMIWDDWKDYLPSASDEERPERAIAGFMALHWSDAKVIADTGRQLFVRKEKRDAISENWPK